MRSTELRMGVEQVPAGPLRRTHRTRPRIFNRNMFLVMLEIIESYVFSHSAFLFLSLLNNNVTEFWNFSDADD